MYPFGPPIHVTPAKAGVHVAVAQARHVLLRPRSGGKVPKLSMGPGFRRYYKW